jgi:cytoskeletal protein CcmA (bactofilin family)
MAETETPPAEENAGNELESQDDVNALEGPSTAPSDGVIDATSSNGGSDKAPSSSTPPPKLKPSFLKRFNIYLLFFLFVLVIAGGIILVAYFQSKKASTSATLKTQSLADSTLKQLASSDATVGSAQQVLNVESSAVFAGKVLIREGLEVAGSLQIGGTAAFNNITVSGISQFGQVQINKNLSVAGDTGLQGAVTIAKGLQVTGSGNFSGPLSAPQITTSTLQLNGDLVLTHHISLGGSTPSRSNGTALGGGGTAAVSGSDSGGTVSVNTGSSPAAGCFATINFSQKYNSTPRILLTPIGSAGGSIDYYVTRSTTSFSICDATPPPAGSSFAFDYFVFN